MPYGISIRNKNTGRVVVDEESFSLHVLRRGTLSNWSRYIDMPRGTAWRCPFTPQSPNSFLFFRDKIGKRVSQLLQPPGQTSNFIISNNGDNIDFAEVVPSNHFSPIRGVYGFEVYDENGNVCFSSARDLVQIGSRYSRGGSNQSGNGSMPYQTYSDSNPWWCPLQTAHGVQRHYSQIMGDNFADQYCGVVGRTGSGQYEMAWNVYGASFTPSGFFTAYRYVAPMSFLTASEL